MGFECGFVKVPIIQDATADEYLYIDAGKNFYMNPFYTDTYVDFKQFMNETYKDFYKDFVCEYPYPDVELYKDVDEEMIDFWCSIGRFLDDKFIHDKLEEIKPFEHYQITLENLEEITESVKEWLGHHKMVQAYDIHAYKDEENGDRTITQIDGLMVEDEDGHIVFLDTELDGIYFSSKAVDPERLEAAKQLYETLLKIKEIDFDKYFVFYFRSY